MTHHDDQASVDETTVEEMAARHNVVASLQDLGAARTLIQDLEKDGIPPGSISLLGARRDEGQATPEAEAVSEVGRSAATGAAGGAVVGGTLATLTALAVPGIGPVLAAGLGAIFGASVGGAAGGISTTKFSSRAWERTYEEVEAGGVVVGVHHGDGKVVDDAEALMRRHPVVGVERLDEE